jgi:beta-N-acetylhexosaminidase
MMSHRIRYLLLAAVIISTLILPITTTAAPIAQELTPEELAAEILSLLTPEERVGQLFLVEFEGSRIEEDSQIFNLIANYHIGGVLLTKENTNFSISGNPMLNTWLLIQELQRTEMAASRLSLIDPGTGEFFSPVLIPLFVGVTQDGDGYPDDQILTGMTPLPNALAIGATWNPEMAYRSGEVLGSELSALGFNLLIGPSLNINNNPRPELGGDLGASSFGGSPYWVGEMGGQYISGVHAGSENQVAVISKHFPGNSGTDRPREEEIPTVRRTLEQLSAFEFQPFLNVTGQAGLAASTTDGLLLSHSKYQSFQSNITTATPPITLDGQALEQLISVNAFSSWYNQGGVIVSDALWNQAIRRFYEQQAADFAPTLIARDALLAGNDVLVLTGLDPDGEIDQSAAIISTLEFFAQKYRDDLAFAQQVDESVQRILTMKYRLYSSFDSVRILTSSTLLDRIGVSSEVVFEIARQSATLINPSRENLINVLPNAPAFDDRIVIITDSYTYQQCDDCPEEQNPVVDALQQEVLRLYGPAGDGLISQWNVISFTSTDLLAALDSGNPMDYQVITEIGRSSWLVFLFLESDEARSESQALVRFLSELPDLTQEKKTLVFSLNAPYFLDATSISQVTAYYGLYSKQPQFIEIAARLLFKELNASGASPVSISGAGYLLEEALAPDPDQPIILSLIPPTEQPSDEETAEEVTPAPVELFQGDTITLETNQILDHNGSPVVNNTVVNFSLTTLGTEGSTITREISSQTVGGIARTNHLLDSAGILEITASTGDPALLSNTLRLEVSASGEGNGGDADDGSLETEVVPTESVDDQPPIDPDDATTLIDWLISLVVTIFISLFTYQLGAVAGSIRWAVRWGLTSFLGGLAANAYLSFGMPGSAPLILEYGIWGIVLCVAAGCLIGWAAGLIWRSANQRNQ